MATLADIRSRFVWNNAAKRWTVNGRFVAEADLKRALTEFADAAGREIKALAGQMADGTINVPHWQIETARLVKQSRIAMTAAAKGGFDRLTARDYGRLGNHLKAQYRYLAGFARDAAAGRLSAGRIVARAGLYASGSAGWYENERRDAAAGVFAQERRVLGAAEHCDDCIAEAARGWVPVGTLREIGSSICRANCRCQFRFRNAPADA